MEGCIPSLLSSGEGDLTLKNSRICYPVPPQPLAPTRDPRRMRRCCSSAAGVARRGGDRPSRPPARHKHDVLCGNVKCILRPDRNVIAHHKCFHPLTRNKTHVRSQKAVFTLTNSAGCCLAVQDLPAPPKAFLMPREQHFMKILPSLSASQKILGFGHPSLK